MTATASADHTCRFVFVDADIRGTIARLHDSFTGMTQLHAYPAEVRHLLGEFLAASLLLGDTIKFEGSLTLQANGQGPVRLLMAEATHDGAVRGIARLDEGALPTDFDGLDLKQLLGNGTLTVTIDARGRERYQSIVPLTGASLAECLTSYFQQSEQLNTFVSLAADDDGASGMLIQELPVQVEQDAAKRSDRWITVQTLASTLTGTELLRDPNEVLIRHLFADENIQVFDETPVRFQCSCSEQRMAGALVSLGEQELATLFREQPVLQLNCEFCGTQYQMDEARLVQLATGGEQLH